MHDVEQAKVDALRHVGNVLFDQNARLAVELAPAPACGPGCRSGSALMAAMIRLKMTNPAASNLSMRLAAARRDSGSASKAIG
jgi:hypothetical protein